MAAKFLNVFLKFVLTHIIAVSNYGVVTKVYIYSTFLAVLFTYGMETTYFRYIQKHKNKQELFNTSFSSLIGSSLVFFLGFSALRTRRFIRSMTFFLLPSWVRSL